MMNELVYVYNKKLTNFIVLLINAVLVCICSSCTTTTTNQQYKRQINDNEFYLTMPPLKPLVIPKDMSLPTQSMKYAIPIPLPSVSANHYHAVGKSLDIRPPIQIISLISNTKIEKNSIACRLYLSNRSEADSANLWAQINHVLKQKKVKLKEKNELAHFLITDWISWPRKDEDIPLQSKHKITINFKPNTIVITVTNEGIKRGKKSISDPIAIQRYNVIMINEIINSIQYTN